MYNKTEINEMTNLEEEAHNSIGDRQNFRGRKIKRDGEVLAGMESLDFKF